MGTRRITFVLVAALWAVTACTAGQNGAPTGTNPARKPSKANKAAAATSQRPPEVRTPLQTRIDPSAATRMVPASGPVVTLTGKVKLLSDQGAGIIANNSSGIISNNTGGLVSDHGGGLVSDHGGGLVSDHGGGLIANNGGGLVGKTKYAALQAGEPVATSQEFLLADAEVTVHDAAGRLLTDAAGKPIVARSDGQGGYKLEARLPAENLVLRTKLWNGGELSAILTKPEAGAREVPIDTAATLGATYVLNRFVKGDQKTYDKLPAAEAERLRRDLETARGLIGAKVPDYQPDALIALTEDLRKQAPTVDKTLADIEVLLLGGLGDGVAADRVALNQPHTMALAADGTLYIGETSFGRVRTVSPQGLLTTLMDSTGGKIPYNVPDLMDMALAADGTMYLVSTDGKRIWKAAPGQKPVVVAGGGLEEGPANGRKATELSLSPASVALAPDGTLYVGEEDKGRLLMIAPDGTASDVVSGGWPATADVVALFVAPDGALLVLHHQGRAGALWRRAKDGSWTQLMGNLAAGEGDVAMAPDGTIYVVEDNGRRLSSLAPDGTVKVIGGEGVAVEPGVPAFVTPAAVVVAADGTLYVSDRRTNLVHARKPDGSWRLVAGATGDAQVSDGFLPFNGPAGVAFDPEGRMVVAESTGHSVKRFDGKTLTTIAGGVKGDAGDGGPALDARFDTPGALTYKGSDLLVLDGRNQRIRVIGADGLVRPLVGHTELKDEKPQPLQPGVPRPAAEHLIRSGTSIAVGPDGLIYWASSAKHQIARLRADNTVELVAGRPYGEDESGEDTGDGGEAAKAGLTAPLGIAFDPKGDLLVSDTGNMRIRKITGLAPGGTPRIEPFAGVSRDGMLAKLFGLQPGWERAEEGTAATDAMLVGPAALCFDAAGNLYLSEVGTANVAALTVEGDSVATETGLDFKLLPPVPSRIRKVTPDGKIYTVGGPGAPLFDPAKGDALGMPTGLAIDPQGRLVVVDVRENAIRLVPKGGY